MKTGKGGGKAPAPKTTPKPAARPSASTVSAPTPTASPSPKPSAARSAPTPNDDADADDPFGVDAASNSRAILLSPRPAKGKTLRLVCPMCETAGFAGPDVSGKEVKCCNEQCALPVFTAPKGEKASVATDPRALAAPTAAVAAVPKKKASPALLLTVIGTVFLAGGSLWFFVFNEPGVKPPPALPPSPGSNPIAAVPLAPTTEKNTDEKPAEKAQPRGEEMRAAILPVIVETALKTEKNRSKHFCRRMAADAYVEAGNLAAARDNIEQLLKLTPKLAYHQVPPLTQIAWRAMAAGNADAAKAALEEALVSEPELKGASRLTFDALTDLAALLFVNGRVADAKSLMKRENLVLSGSSMSLSMLARRAHLLHSFDVDEAAASLPIIPWKSPQWVMTTIILVLRGHADQGADWIKLALDAETKADCWAAWGDVIVAANTSDAATKDEAIAAKLKAETPATQARVWARVASARAAAKQSAAASKAIANAATAMKAVPVPADFVLLEMKELMKQELSEAITPRLNAIAAAEVARAQTQLGQLAPAAESLTAALQHLRGHAPCPFAAGRLFEATSRDTNAVKAQLKKALDLKTDDRVQTALTNYRAKCRLAFDAANARFALQTEILKAAVEWPLTDAVFSEATAHSAEGTPDEAREEFLKTNLSVRLGQRLRAAGKLDQARQCDNAVTTGELTDARDTLQRETAEAVAKGGVADAARKLETYQPAKPEGERNSTEDGDWPLLWGLRLSCRLVKAGKTAEAFDLVGSFKDNMLWREEGYEMLSAMIAKDPTAAESIWKKYRPSLLTPTEKIAIFRGLCAGLSASLPPKS